MIDDEDQEAIEQGGPLAQIIEQAGVALDRRIATTRGSFLQGIGELLAGHFGPQAERALSGRMSSSEREIMNERLAEMRERLNRIRAEMRRRREAAEATPQGGRYGGFTAREVMGFSEDTELTAELISKRRKALAKIYHPDVPDAQGSPEAMQRINEAADELLGEL